MSLFGTLNTSISGMAAQANKLSAIGDNIANSSTTGYKRASTEFETLLGYQTPNNYESGGVQTRVRYGVSEQGTISATTSTTDLAIQGNGFFVVQGPDGTTALTRAGSFVPDANGNLVNTAGYKLLGYSLADGSKSTTTGTGALTLVTTNNTGLIANASTTGVLGVNLDSRATAVAAANLPSTNSASATYTSQTSITAYDNLGTPITLDVYMTKTSDNTWEASVYNKAQASTSGTSSFPYSSGPLVTQNLSFDSATGNLSSASSMQLSIPISNGKTVAIDLSKTTQLATDYTVNLKTIDGNAPSKVEKLNIGTDGTVSSVFANGTTVANYKIALADVESPSNLTTLNGDVYQVSTASGPMNVATAQSGNLGTIDASSLEASTVDLATELTSMISAQRGYEANSKVLQATSDLLKVINNLQV